MAWSTLLTSSPPSPGWVTRWINPDRPRHTKALIDGRIKIDGCNINFRKSGIDDINTNVFSGPQTLDVAEIGLDPFLLAYADDYFSGLLLTADFSVAAVPT